ncbi:hypothetical protein DL98DRAFT_637759 [Cadophora sp. DSE1049]|nr:hypothetical protein DL98DRAFT_637759 [Cadophora sp. DSE1049]
MPIYITILKEVCLNLRDLTLHQTWGTSQPRHSQLEGVWHWPTTPQLSTFAGSNNTQDDERYCEMVQKVAKGIPTLRRLQLGDYDSPQGDPQRISVQHDCRSPIKWIHFVAKRAEESFIEKLKGMKVGEHVNTTIGPERMFTPLRRWKLGEARYDQDIRRPRRNGTSRQVLECPSTGNDTPLHQDPITVSKNEERSEGTKYRESGKYKDWKLPTGSANLFALLMDNACHNDP